MCIEMIRRFLHGGLLASAVLAHLAEGHAGQPAAVAPSADHHAHIWSLKASQLATDPLLPAVKLPEDLARLLKDREELVRSKDAAIMATLYTEDAMVLDAMAPTWLQGKDAIEFIATSMSSVPMAPMAYNVTGESGYIAGTYTQGEGPRQQHLANFLLVLRKDEQAKWRIAVETFTPDPPPIPREVPAAALVKELDEAGIQKAVVLSVAYWFGGPNAQKAGGDEYANVRAENDWVAGQAEQYPDRLVPFFSVNPLKPYAVEEVNRCADSGRFRGLKLHLGNSRVDVRKPEHAAMLRDVFAAANERRLPIVIHLWTIDKDYGATFSEALLNEVLPAAPDIVVQIAHMAASGPGYHSDDAFEVFARAAESGDPRMRLVYTDVASMVTKDMSPQSLELVARRLRQFGINKVLFASDRVPGGSNAAPAEAWSAFRRLPLTPEEFEAIAGNSATYLHD